MDPQQRAKQAPASYAARTDLMGLVLFCAANEGVQRRIMDQSGTSSPAGHEPLDEALAAEANAAVLL
jgi:hypothetical protein